ncbi:MAG: amino acid adenylation domain-containing protein, partial [Planctomycetes bacterium]|nr:amino acid adenylation domain-containing protein [Planctomycetota bacterium]
LFIAHHIVFDGWSIRIFLSELTELYKAFCDNRPSPLPEPQIQYADYAYWHRQWLQGEDLKNQLSYWRESLGDELPILQMPTDYPRPTIQSIQGAIEKLNVDQELVVQLNALGRSENATLFMVLLAAFKVLLHRYTGQDDLIVGSPIANRTNTQTEGMIGFFANTLVLRTKLKGTPTFRTLLRQVRDMCLEAYANPDAPFERLVEELNPERDLSRTPLFQVLFSFQVDPSPSLMMSEITITPIEVPLSVARTDLSLWINKTDEGLNLGLEYCTDLFRRDTIVRMLQNFQILLEAIIADPDKGIKRLPLLSETEHCTLLRDWNATSAAYSESMCVHQLIQDKVSRHPEKVAVVFGQERISYEELNERSNQLAHFLRGEGVGPDTFVGICIERSTEMMIGVLGILKAGGAYLPLDPDYPVERLSYMMEDSGTSVVLTQSSLLGRLPVQERVRIICLDSEREAIEKHSSVTPEVENRQDNLAYIIYTSGSTGKPKGVQVPHGAVVNFLTSMSREPGFSEDDVLLAVTTLSFDIHVLEIFLPLIVGGRVVIADLETASDGDRLLKTLNESQATVMQATPSTWRLLLAAGWEGNQNLKVLCGGEAFPRDLLKDLLPRAGSVWNMYGPTETTVWSSCYHITDSEGPILIGRPIANTQIYILDRLMQPVPIGVPGELHIGGDGVTWGYLNRPELTEKQFVPDPFRSDPGARLYKTGDLARFRPDGNLEYLSRIDTQVKVRGFRIELGEIESVLSDHSSVDKCVAAVREDQPGDVRLVGYIVAKADMEVAVSDLRNHLKTKLPDYMVPQHFVELEELPLTPAGKVDRKNLPPPDQTSAYRIDEYVAPHDVLELQLTKLWEKTIGVSPISVTDNFFDIGGHSLLAVRLFSRIEKTIGAKLPLALLYQASTIEQLAVFLKEKNWQAAWSCLVPIRPGGSKPPLFLIHGAGGNVLLYRQLVQHLGSDHPVYGLQAKGLDGNEPFHTRIEDMAAEYISEIQKLQPDGPYYLGGYCMGGGIAYEMARQLEEKGFRIVLVALFDTFNGWKKTSLLGRLHHQYERIAFHILNYGMIDRAGRKMFLNEKVQESKRRVLNWFAVKISRLLYKTKLRSKKPLVILDDINDQMAHNYVPKPYSGKIDVFRTISAYSGYEDPLLGWGNDLTGSVEVHQLNVYPAGTLNEPFVAELASKLRDCLDKVQS